MSTSCIDLGHYYRLQEKLSSLEKGRNIIVIAKGVYSLMKYEGFETEIEDHCNHRHNRHTTVVTFNWLFEDKNTYNSHAKKEWKRHKLNIFGTHCINFNYDHEFKLFLPSSKDSDLFFTIAAETMEGEIVSKTNVKVITDDNLIFMIMNKITRPNYFVNVISPFIKGEPTALEPPKIVRKKIFRKHPYLKAYENFSKTVSGLRQGSFIYTGCKEEVYLLSVAKDDDGCPQTQGSYILSEKPLFYFSNNYLDFISRHDAEKPKFEGEGPCNVAKYRTYEIPSFGGKYFIFPQMGRKQDCKNFIFNGYPEVITGDIKEALEHFSSTDFWEYNDIVNRYAELVGSVHLSSGKPNEQPCGKYYY